jgi:1-acyl-sn-glycerol-3-phosphate acyltransferase
MLTRALIRVRSLFVSIPLIILFTLVLGIAVLAVSLIPCPKRIRRRFYERAMRLWARAIVGASFLRARVVGLENIAPNQTYIFCANHLSYLDPPLIAAFLPNRVRFLAKRSLFRIPVFGWAMRRMGHLPLDRENAREASRNLAEAAREFGAGSSIVVFPEGGRSIDGRLGPFLSGGFRLAISLEAPVVPVAIQGTHEALTPGSLYFRGGTVRMLVGRPIFTRGIGPRDREALSAKVRTAIAAMLQQKI